MRLYGPSLGYGSWARVAAGLRVGLAANDCLSAFVPIDNMDDDDVYGGNSTDAVMVGPPKSAPVLSNLGQHSNRYFVLAPNSSWLPEDMMAYLEPHVTEYVAPSAWGKSIIEKYTKLPVSVWHHGISEEFKESWQDHDYLTQEYNKGKFSVLHMTSTTRHRKGTYELIEAWASAIRRKSVGRNSMLRIVVEGPTDVIHSAVNDACMGDHVAVRSVVVVTRMNMAISQAAKLYRTHHVVCQPSRGEGFGLVPLEARASGVATVVTACTGHSAHVKDDASMVIVPHRDAGPIDDGPGAIAPVLDVKDLEIAIVDSFDRWKEISHQAMNHASQVRQNWSWATVTKKWLEERK